MALTLIGCKRSRFRTWLSQDVGRSREEFEGLDEARVQRLNYRKRTMFSTKAFGPSAATRGLIDHQRYRKYTSCTLPPTATTTMSALQEAFDARLKYTHFRILVIGRANAGKTTLLKRVCNTDEEPCIYDEGKNNLVSASSISVGGFGSQHSTF